MTGACVPPSPTDAYRRQARRLRGRFAGRPDRLQQSLKQLAAAASIQATAAAPLPVASRARSYADHVAASMPASGVLRYSQRLQLLRAAPRFGLNRFEANLAIAAVMSRQRGRPATQDPHPADRSLISGVAAFVVVQGALLLGTWWTLFR